ncbi:MAG: cysteine--tRNA ligase, partial [Candidatus Methanomethyliaceae archaeon]|nr:cysteine--tRNA ligase [Candidatus Methanomethyliaceae archaeon]
TRTQNKEELILSEPGKVKIYVCGPTVYDICHIGHARSYVCFDVLKRYLIELGYRVVHIQNFTDIDDKIFERARREGVSSSEISERYINEYFKDMDALNIMRASKYTRVTEYLQKIVEIVEKLLNSGYAYRYGNEIYFDVEASGGFGELIKNVGEFIVDSIKVEGKRKPFDFVLWKFDENGFNSKIGRGFPGWHAECVVMSMENLGNEIDIHWGGKDLIYPHHECESLIAKALVGKRFVKYWMHNGLVLLEGRKMSKSSSKIYIREILKYYPAPVLRMWILSKHYRRDLSFSEEDLNTAWKKYEKIKRAAKKAGDEENSKTKEYIQEFLSAMNDDMNTEKAIEVVEEFSEKNLHGLRLYKIFERVLGIEL